MPRAGWRKPESERRLSDLVSVGVLTRTFPPVLVDEVIADLTHWRETMRPRIRETTWVSYEMAVGRGKSAGS